MGSDLGDPSMLEHGDAIGRPCRLEPVGDEDRRAVTGEVLQPSPMPLTDVPARVQDAIAFAHGFTPEADPGNVTLTRGGKAQPVPTKSPSIGLSPAQLSLMMLPLISTVPE